ncbi:phosphoribosylglycinamide formyltransferase [Schaalia vaccimaxillae]|uniref:phosphoribosylglycinamide formyltransferase n=1 Tax=Schaalia vaccimaxillae TaxID=183916 RepID=UPI0003B41500|nr:phosphoribosylglycinamide formyltransferase [Schaalia vaccimaxillae]
MTPTLQTPIHAARVLVLVSGEGSNMRALVEAADEPAWGGSVVAVGADRACAGIDWARQRGIPVFVHPYSRGDDRAQWDEHLAGLMAEYQPDLIVCAGYLKLLGPAVLDSFEGRILNTHNSLLPAFPGVHGPADAIDAGVKVSGATLFFVDPGVDTGRIVAQTAVPVLDEDDADSLLNRIKVAERVQLVEAVGRLIREGWTTDGRRVRFGEF